MSEIHYKNVEIKISCKNDLSGKFYVYKTEFPDAACGGIIPYYFGRRRYKGDPLKDSYIGSPLRSKKIFTEQIAKRNRVTKEIIEIFSDTAECSVFEKNLIEKHHGKKGCLNGSIFSPSISKEQMIENCSKAYKAGLGKLSKEERKRIQKEGIAKKIGGKEDLTNYYKNIGANGGKKGGRKSYESKLGIHNLQDKRVIEGRAKGHKAIAKKYAKEFSIIDPNGNLVKTKNLHKFCQDYNLNRGNINLLLKGKIKSSMGWTKPS